MAARQGSNPTASARLYWRRLSWFRNGGRGMLWGVKNMLGEYPNLVYEYESWP